MPVILLNDMIECGKRLKLRYICRALSITFDCFTCHVYHLFLISSFPNTEICYPSILDFYLIGIAVLVYIVESRQDFPHFAISESRLIGFVPLSAIVLCC